MQAHLGQTNNIRDVVMVGLGKIGREDPCQGVVDVALDVLQWIGLSAKTASQLSSNLTFNKAGHNRDRLHHLNERRQTEKLQAVQC